MAMKTPIKLDMQSPLPAQLANAPPQSTHVNLKKDIPSDTDWALLSSHFTSVAHLYMDSGWDERLNDNDIPSHWPLRKLIISSSCGERCLSPWIIQGRVEHLVFYYTCGLRFEGPTTEELLQTHREAVEKGEKEEEKVGDLTITYLPDLAMGWMKEKYFGEGQEKESAVENPIPDPNIQLRTLEIIYNDALDTFFRYSLALPNILQCVQTLNLVASSEHDLHQAPDNILHQVLPQLENLKTLVLTIGDNFSERELLPNLVGSLPPNLEVLRFRSSVSLATTDPASFDAQWVQVFANPTFLPNLKKLSFVLDLEQRKPRRGEFVQMEEEGEGEEAESSAETDTEVKVEARMEDVEEVTGTAETEAETNTLLSQAKKACERLWRAAESRGVVVEPWSVIESRSHVRDVLLPEEVELDSPELMGIEPVDERWDKL